VYTQIISFRSWVNLGGQQAHALGSATQRHLRPGHSGVLLGAKLGLSADRTLDELRQRLALPKHSLKARF
jgi:hypothetical protein